MLREQARIVAIEDGRMRLAPVASGCGGCASAAGCGMARFGRLLPAIERALVLPAEPGRRVGELVELAVPESTLLSAALIAYLPPLLGLLLGALAISPAGAALAPLGAGLGTLAGLAATRLLARARAAHHLPAALDCRGAAAPTSNPPEFHHD